MCHVVQPLLVVCSGEDEYVPAGVDQAGNGHRLLAACGPLAAAAHCSEDKGDGTQPLRSVVVLAGADHGLSDPVHAAAFVDHVSTFLALVAGTLG